jgi:hypothetical protein
MKKKLFAFLSAILLLVGTASSQAPQKFNYQGIARNSSGEPLASKLISLKISILDVSNAGAVKYAETHSVTTNAFGLYNIEIGSGTIVSGTIAGINWSVSKKFLKVEIDPNGGSAYTTIGNTELLSVPYALYAASGNPGPTGPKGDKGDNGVPGATGPVGPIGPTGNNGAVGPIGPAGANGVPGATGPVGPIGATGPAGSANINGTTGNIIKFTGATTGGNSVLSEETDIYPTNLNIGTETQPVQVNFYGPNTESFYPFFEGTINRGYFGSYSGANEDIDFGTGSRNPKGGIHLTIQAIPKLTVDKEGNVGIGTTTPTSILQIKGENAIATITNTIEEAYPGILLNNTATSNIGVGLYGKFGLGLIVTNLDGSSYAPVFASAFTVPSDINTKKEINYLTSNEYDKYLKEIRNISSATYRYKWENENTRPIAHLGFISQSLPTSVQAEMDANPSGGDEKIIGYNLSDLAGLTVLGIKALDQKVIEQEKTIQTQAALIIQLQNQVNLIPQLQKRLEALENK